MHSIESFRLMVQEFNAKSDRIIEYSRHRLATGLHRERIVESFIKKLTPDSLGVGSGFIFNGDESSPQVDLIIHDKSHHIPIFDEGGYLILAPASTVQVMEVKSNLDKSQLLTALNNTYQTRKLTENSRSTIFGFDGIKDVQKVFDVIEEFSITHNDDENLIHLLPDIIVNLNNWVLVKVYEDDCVKYIHSKTRPFEEQFMYFFYFVYYFNYSYLKGVIAGTLPSLSEQGYITFFNSGKVEYLRLKPKYEKINGGGK